MSVPRRVPPLLLCVAAAGAQRAITRLGQSNPAPPGGMVAVSALITAASGVALAAPVVAFRLAGTTVDPREHAAPATLVTSGVNRISRNPMYLGMAGLLVAHAVARRSVAAVLPAAIFVGWIDRVQIPAEEADLRERFGAGYDRYSGRVPRWIGRPLR